MASKVIPYKLRLHHYTCQTRTGSRAVQIKVSEGSLLLGKSKKHSYKPKVEDSIQENLYLLHMDLCGPMRIQSINSSGPEPQLLTLETISSGLVQNPSSATPVEPPTKNDWEILFQPIFDEHFNPSPSVASLVPAVVAPEPADSTGSPSSTQVDQDAPSPSTSQTPKDSKSLVISSGVAEEFHDIEVTHLDNDPFFGVPILESNSKESSSRDVIPTNMHSVNQPPEHLRKWTKDHPLDNVIDNPSRPVST
ncbi:hypothetical protein Tco_0636066 [Tanacetum coccineum]